ncbi:hypothetical protein [Marinagarivorans algicola]|uniref:hypothetical protein n=1 Tax=Marinagarivorans algicola TaxID=1513270 RepID=UPI0006B47DE9|nr:hypothetical protein [Marinagarivorans algicola]
MNILYRASIVSFLVPILIACGDDTNQKKNQATSSSLISSSQQSVSSQGSLVVDYIYPGNYSHIGDESKTAIIVRTPEKLDRVYLDSVEFMEVSENIWRISSIDLPLNTINQKLEIKGVAGNNSFNFQPLVVSNDFSQSAGLSDRASASDSLAFSKDGSIVYFTGSQFGRVSALDLATADIQVLYESTQKKRTYWPLALDYKTQNLYVIEHDNFYAGGTFDESLGANFIKINVVSKETVSTRIINEKVNVSALVIDSNAKYPFSKGRHLGYLVDEESDIGLQAILLDGEQTAAVGGMNTTYEAGAEFTSDVDRTDIALSSDGQIIYTLKNIPEPTLLQLSSFVDELGSSSLLTVKMPLKYMDLAVKSATAVALSPFNSSVVYIADGRDIWRANIETGLLEVISSSIPGNKAKGVGPDFSGTLTDIQHHPFAEVLYVSQGSFGMMAVDIETGDRSIVIN